MRLFISLHYRDSPGTGNRKESSSPEREKSQNDGTESGHDADVIGPEHQCDTSHHWAVRD